VIDAAMAGAGIGGAAGTDPPATPPEEDPSLDARAAGRRVGELSTGDHRRRPDGLSRAPRGQISPARGARLAPGRLVRGWGRRRALTCVGM